MKKQFNARLSPDTLLAIKVKAKEWDCSEAEVIERWAAAKEPTQWAGASDRIAYVPRETHPAGLPDNEDVEVAPRPATPQGRLAVAMAALVSVSKGSHLAPGLLDAAGNPNTPTPCFDVHLDGEPHRVRLIKNTRYLFHLGEGGENRLRPLAPGELETFWAQRIK
jgi:hypothetical protein